ncbi:class F sortase [Streptomyces tagetis]|uniref:Class F sortase n=1 Tax=Streptomyces tagetis TaxID=2820809 RepID=A0A940XH35_9ACTN|nr:class F sortase [Streptomyces sp. RG38]MBQ0827057.1 class F sortase [Streptomyces sp. RG38]
MPVPPSAPLGQAPPGQGSRGGTTVLCAVVLLLLAVNLLGGKGTSADSTPPPAPARAGASAAPSATSAISSAGTADGTDGALPRSAPVRLRIPGISVDAPFTGLALAADGRLQPPPPDDTNLVGWYAKGVSPGEKGTAIIAGHVDTIRSAAVFARLDQLEEGDRFQVERADGRTASFVVDSLETFEKSDFPSERVYDPADRPEVRLITCAGSYDRTARDYTDNLVVFAHLA